ncbi:cytochrome P450 [Novosphingobium sp. G106]|uniref:cytochrome P450 n=1 Tax=Novosphingobium sp. G106 TaxID=2849500 RepID=UPI001C2DBC44|nr:cytochrome P450 [Novosphingobium sp. G106]MBV1689207.1 cytochrome P450 [Novosphingobium sp. G106]
MEIDFARAPGDGLPLELYARLHEAGPVVWSDSLGGWAVSGYAEVRSVFGDVTRFTSAGTPVAEALGEQGMLVNDTPLHHTIRAVWTKQVGIAALALRRAELEANAAEAIAAARVRMEAGEAVDFIPLIREFVIRFITASFGVPAERGEIFHRWSVMSSDTPAVAMDAGSTAEQSHYAVRAAVFELIDELAADRKRRLAASETPEDLTTLMVAAEGRDGITPSIVRDNLFNFILGALDTTEKWLGNILVKLCGNTAFAEELRASPDLIAPFAEEVMRCDTVAQSIQRNVRHDGVELGGRRLGAGEPVFLLLGAANRDPTIFSDPDSFAPRRKGEPHLGFGFGFHHCLGINVARAEARAFIGKLLQLPDLRVVASDFGESWALWGPRKLQLAI